MSERLLAKYVEMINQEDGQGMVEYGLLLAFVAVVAGALAATGGLQTAIEGAIDAVESAFTAIG